jgi:AraC-like DNA-binding protein
MEPLVNATVPEGYVEHAPPPDLATAVICAWTQRVSSAADVALHRVLPDGCTDILFVFGRPGAHDRELVSASVVGAMTRPIIIEGPHPWLYVGIRLAPGYAQAAFRVPASELTDQTVDYDLLERDAAAHVETLAAASPVECVAAAFDIVRNRLARGVAVSRSLRVAVRRIVEADGNLKVAALAGEIGVTRQQLARQFAAHVGLTPKMFARVVRARAALGRAAAARVAHPRNVNWSAIANDLGYYDQPHFIDDFKEITGQTPGEWLG